MSAEIKKYKARIFGELYSIVSDEPEAVVAEVVNKVDSYMKEIASKTSMTVDSKRIAVLAALKATQELLILQRQQDLDYAHIEKIMLQLNKEDNSLL